MTGVGTNAPALGNDTLHGRIVHCMFCESKMMIFYRKAIYSNIKLFVKGLNPRVISKVG